MTVLDPAVREVVDAAPVAHLATTLPDGAPHATPVWIGVHDDHLVFFTGPGSRKARNLRRDPRVALSIAPADDPFRPALIRGHVVEWIDGDAGWRIVDAVTERYLGSGYPRDAERVVAVIEVDTQRVG